MDQEKPINDDADEQWTCGRLKPLFDFSSFPVMADGTAGQANETSRNLLTLDQAIERLRELQPRAKGLQITTEERRERDAFKATIEIELPEATPDRITSLRTIIAAVASACKTAAEK